MRDLQKDLELCNKRTPGPCKAVLETYSDYYSLSIGDGDNRYYAEHLEKNDAKFFAAAWEGWPEAIKRAMEAEAELQGWYAAARAWKEHREKLEARVKELEYKLIDKITEIAELKRELASVEHLLHEAEQGAGQVNKEIEELETQCVAMRQLLKDIISDLERPEQGILPPWKTDLLMRAKSVTSSEAGKALLERMAKLEAMAEAAEVYVQAIDSIWAGKYDLSTVPKGEMLPEEIRLRKALAELEGVETDGELRRT